MTDAEYRLNEMMHVLDNGPHPEEDFFRLQVRGKEASRWINITVSQLYNLAYLLGEDDA